jgi:hypothetical protein
MLVRRAGTESSRQRLLHSSARSASRAFLAVSPRTAVLKQGGRLGAAEIILPDDNGAHHVFTFETFFIRYKGPTLGEALTLGVYSRQREVSVTRTLG